ncbi:hypothetical protein SAMN05877809_105290 [Rhodobacter sp. JA431]|uniref:hypothetical protein n=1 Tax=Rhodobacter sp. JA431 TaxID=570013 RepID=UPI000BD6FBD1|nr:hypothetical protein [Rhodobacter sp. JA431]SOC11454.1 hypothetical protein SAMN05877809_105290 [Rhodobacter sp. JA431]
MADVTGTCRHQFGGKSYSLRLTWGVMAKLQAEYGEDFLDRLEIKGNAIPFALMIAIIGESLIKGEKMGKDEAYDLADDFVSSDPELIGRVVKAAFPDAEVSVGNGGEAAA